LFAAHELGVAVPEAPLAQLRPRRFDPSIGRRLVALRVLRSGPQVPVRSLRWMLSPGADVLATAWEGEPGDRRSLARAYVRRAAAQWPLVRSSLRRPWTVVQDYRLNGQISALEPRD